MSAEKKTAEKEIVFTKYEKVRIIGARALQISMGAPFLIEVKPADMEKMKFNPVEIAKMEYDAGKIPISVKRVMPYERV